MDLTDRARADLEAYLARVTEAAEEALDVDADAVAAGVREHVAVALEERETSESVTAAELAEVLERLGEPAEWIEPDEGAPGGSPGIRGQWHADRRGLEEIAGDALRIGLRILEVGIAAVALIWPLAVIWSQAQRGGFLYEWVEGGTPWQGFRPPIYWGRIGTVGAGTLGAWFLLLAILLTLPAAAPLRSRLRSLWGLDARRALLIAGTLFLLIATLGAFL